MPTKYELLLREWEDCDRCILSHCRKKVVMARGSVPCDVLLVGEAPGESEDVLGQPFVGPAGKLLDKVLQNALPGHWSLDTTSKGKRTPAYARIDRRWHHHLALCFTNLVGCIPREEGRFTKAAQPPDDAIEACRPRLEALIEMCRPRLIVAVGAMARDWLEQGSKYSVKIPRGEDGSLPKQIDVTHPAAVLRANVAQRGLMIQRMRIQLEDAVEEVFGEHATDQS
jgi:uracil-DNA glycosylase